MNNSKDKIDTNGRAISENFKLKEVSFIDFDSCPPRYGETAAK